MFEDSLHYLPIERWSELQNVFKGDWPRCISGYAALETQKRWKKQGLEHEFKVYSPYGNVTDGMVAIHEKNKSYEVVIICPKDVTSNLEAALRTTKIIDWNSDITIPFAPNNVLQCIKNIIDDVGIEFTEIQEGIDTFVLEQMSFVDVCLAANITFGPVTMEHVDLIESTWPHRCPNSPWYFQTLIKANSGFGLYLNNVLISWAFIKEAGPLMDVYTVEDQRRKGFGELVLKLVSNKLIEEKRPVYAFCLSDNIGAAKVYKKLGFIKTDQIVWCHTKKRFK